MTAEPESSCPPLDVTSPSTPSSTIPVPRSRRVGFPNPPSQFSLDLLNLPPSPSSPSFSLSSSPSPSSPTPSLPTSCPPLPPRSPLRPPARSLSNSISNPASPSASTTSVVTPKSTPTRPDTPPASDLEDIAAIAGLAPFSFQMRDRDSYPSMSTLVSSVTSMTISENATLSKALPLRPDSPMSLQLDEIDDEEESPTSSVVPPTQQTLTKRQHALLELLSSERAYASDLALLRTTHIPLALGQTVPLQQTPPSPPNSSASSSRTLSTSSDSSIAALGPPMTQEDVKVIFNNVSELAMFSDALCEDLEGALGALLEGGVGEDRVGALFLRIIPELEKPYKLYITRHSNAVSHLQSLPSTPALQAYFQHTQAIASTHSHAWDLNSLLIKPVQRLLKYPLLLSAIIDETPDSHSDKENLKEARKKLEEVARNVNEGRRRAEVIKDVLSGGKKLKMKPTAGVGVSASVNLTKMKSLRHGGPRAVNLSGESEEAALVERMQRELKEIDGFMQKFARNVVDWAKMTSNVVLALRAWAASFGKVIGLSPDQDSEAFNAFLDLVEQQLMPLCIRLEAVINDKWLKEIAHLLMTMNQPLKLLASMDEQEPYHYHLMTMNVSKTRPPQALMAASTNYLALRGQLAAELPQYIALLHRGLATLMRKLAEIQTDFWHDVRKSWAGLWEMLRVDGEWNAGFEETVNVWCARWSDVDEVVGGLNIVQSKKLYQEPVRYSVDPSGSAGKRKGSAVSNMLSSLDPVHVGPYAVSGPYPLTPSIKSRARGNSDASMGGGGTRRSVGRRTSNDSLRSGKSSRMAKSPRREYPPQEYMIPDVPMIPRTNSMSLSPDKTVRPSLSRSTTGYTDDGYGQGRPSTSRTTTGGYADDGHSGYAYGYAPASPYRQPPDSAPVQMQYYEQERDRDRDRGRSSQGANSYKRKSAETPPPRRPSNTRQRSGSNVSSFPQASQSHSHHHQHDPEPAPMPNRRDSWATRPAKYVCQVIHPCRPPPAISYFSFPFFTLEHGEFYEVLQEAGHPSIHPKLPLYVDEGEDCLLLCRDGDGRVGWALASFLEPVSIPR